MKAARHMDAKPVRVLDVWVKLGKLDRLKVLIGGKVHVLVRRSQLEFGVQLVGCGVTWPWAKSDG